MEGSRFTKTPKLSIVLQITDTTATDADGQSWEVHDIERNRGFKVELSRRAREATPAGKAAVGRPFTAEEVEAAIGLAIERALVTPPEKVSGTLYDVAVTSEDLYESLALGR